MGLHHELTLTATIQQLVLQLCDSRHLPWLDLCCFLFVGVIHSISHRTHLPVLAALHTRKYEVWGNREYSLPDDPTGEVFTAVLGVSCNVLCSLITLIRAALEASMWLLWPTTAVKMNCNSQFEKQHPGEDVLNLCRAAYFHCAATVASSKLDDSPT